MYFFTYSFYVLDLFILISPLGERGKLMTSNTIVYINLSISVEQSKILQVVCTFEAYILFRTCTFFSIIYKVIEADRASEILLIIAVDK